MTTARTCMKCGAQATLYATKTYHLFSISKRYYCGKCHTDTEKHEDAVLIVNLLLAALLVAGSVYLNISPMPAFGARTPTPMPVYDARDFNRDGTLDLFESQATDQQVKLFNELGYPWNTVETGKTPTRAVLGSYPIKEWGSLFQSDKDVQMSVMFPDLMLSFLHTYTNPDNPLQLDRVFLTTTRDLAYILHRYETPPSQWPSQTPAPVKSKKLKKEAKEEKEIRAVSPVPILEIHVCYEALSLKRALELARRFGISEDKLPQTFREGK